MTIPPGCILLPNLTLAKAEPSGSPYPAVKGSYPTYIQFTELAVFQSATVTETPHCFPPLMTLGPKGNALAAFQP